MLDNLRAMGVFACVVERGSFSGAAKDLGITTSAVSQQIRSLENELEVVLLHRSTRRISLTEAGFAFFQSCQEMMAAAERGKIRISELQDNLVGELVIATTPELAALHLVPALSQWMMAHSSLAVRIDAAHQYVNLNDHHIDIAIRMSPQALEQDDYEIIPLARVEQILVASPTYINHNPVIEHPRDLEKHNLLPVTLMKDYQRFCFKHVHSMETFHTEMAVKLKTNNVYVMKALCQTGNGIARILYLDVQSNLKQGNLMEILPDWKLPEFTLYAVILKREHQPVKVTRCLDALKTYFSQIPGGR